MLPVECVEEKASKIPIQQVPPENLFPFIAYFRLLLLPFCFFGLFLLLFLVCLDIDLVWFCSGLAYEIYSGSGLST